MKESPDLDAIKARLEALLEDLEAETRAYHAWLAEWRARQRERQLADEVPG